MNSIVEKFIIIEQSYRASRAELVEWLISDCGYSELEAEMQPELLVEVKKALADSFLSSHQPS